LALLAKEAVAAASEPIVVTTEPLSSMLSEAELSAAAAFAQSALADEERGPPASGS